MRKYFIYAFLFLFGAGIGKIQAGQFIEGMEDIPLMDGFSQITQDDISFGNEETRLVEAYLTSAKITFKQMTAFYKESLPQLGWIYKTTLKNGLSFYRDGETLELVRESVSPLIVRVTMKTKP